MTAARPSVPPCLEVAHRAAAGGASAAHGAPSVTGSELRQFPVPVAADPSGRSPAGRVIVLICLAALLMAAGPVLAGQAASPPQAPPAELSPAEPSHAASTIGAPPPQGPCVQVEVGGERVGHLQCATEALQAAARVARDQARAPLETPTPGAGSPAASIGLSSVSGARLRLGPALGTSVHRPGQGAVPPTRGGRP
jgi:hypothetical protein